MLHVRFIKPGCHERLILRHPIRQTNNIQFQEPIRLRGRGWWGYEVGHFEMNFPDFDSHRSAHVITDRKGLNGVQKWAISRLRYYDFKIKIIIFNY